MIVVRLVLVACATAGQSPDPATATSTPEVPPPTEEVSVPTPPEDGAGEVMSRCVAEATEQTVISSKHGYCYAFPVGFERREDVPGAPLILGPALDESLDPVRAMLQIDVTEVPEGTPLEQAVTELLAEFAGMPTSGITQRPTLRGGEEAVVLEVVPGRTGSRDVVALHNGKRSRLLFMPSARDFPQAEADVEALYRTVMESFTFLPNKPPGAE